MEHNDFLITESEELIRIDKLLSKKYQSTSRTYFQYLLENGSVLVNGNKVKKRFTPKLGDEVEIFFQALPDSSLQAENIPLEILYEDEHILAINKPAGMVVHPGCGNWKGTFVNALLYYCKDLICVENDLRPGIVHRLDKDTTGVLLAAKTQKAHEKLIDMFKLRKIKKTYLAITLNKPENQLINAPICRHPISRKKMHVSKIGKEAITEIKLLAFKDNLSLVSAHPHSGRTHQIRVHLKHINCPVLGDDVYGSSCINKKYNISKHLLHAYIIEFNHPITNYPMRLSAPINPHFKKFIKILS